MKPLAISPPSMTDKPTVMMTHQDTSMPSNIITFVNTGKMSKQDMYDYISQQAVSAKHIHAAVFVGPYGGSQKAVRVWLQPDSADGAQQRVPMWVVR
ncbi:hypothetical protein OH492_28715 [Vibrio chagasii]|nr:hypothetical protein [Vibrio chagasii]